MNVRDLLESCIAQIETHNPRVNAVVATDYDAARALADTQDKTRTDHAELPPLFGLPVLVKDLIETRDMKTTFGSLCFKDHIPRKDGDIVRRLREAGAIILGKTNTPEFGAGANTFNKVYGATRNPHNRALTCGGSSGGSAVAVACNMAPLAIGSDFGGSLRIPASFCGVVGMRPTPGRVPCSDLAIGNSPLWTEGPMARSVEDAALCLSVIEGGEPGDPRSSQDLTLSRLEDVDLSKLKLGVSLDFDFAVMEDGLRKAARKQIDRILQFFASNQKITPDFSTATEIFRTFRVLDVSATANMHGVTNDSRLGDNVKANLAETGALTIGDTATNMAAHSRLMRGFHALFDGVDVIIAPATGVSPFPVEQPYPATINGKPLENYTGWYALTWAISLTGCPVVSIPCGTDPSGLPFGLQVIAPRHRDTLALSVASRLSSELRATSNSARPLR
ncbi:MAG: amidase [Paracoccaceae bacterium]